MSSPVVLDFETYYAPKDRYSLRVMSIEQYVLDARFQAHGCTVLDREAGVDAFLGLDDFKHYLKSRRWDRLAAMSHNARFDMAILCWRFGVLPGAIIDTMSIANVFIKPYTGRVSLEECCKHLGIEGKNISILNQCANLTTEQIKATPGLWKSLGEYALGDGHKCEHIYHEHWWKMGKRERVIMDWSIRNYVRGRLRIDLRPLYENLHREESERAKLLKELNLESPSVLRSANSFAEHLRKLGVEVGYKYGKNDELIPAFAKDDEFMRAHAEHPDPRVRLAIKGRLAFQSNLEITRTKRLIDMAVTTKGIMLVPLNYCAAHTGRFGGAESINVQNFKRETPERKALMRRAIRAPKGYKLVCVDASQIEARLVAWLAGCLAMCNAFARKIDLYAVFASSIYGRAINKNDDPTERQVGKVSILQLGYQSGPSKLQRKLEASGIVMPMEEARAIVYQYRDDYEEIPALWKRAESAMRWTIRDQRSREFVTDGILFTPMGIMLPSGRWIYYPMLREATTDEVDTGLVSGQMAYWSPRYKTWKQLYGGSIVENIIQAMARDVVTEVHLKYVADTVMQAHDEIVQCVPAEIAEQRRLDTIRAMSIAPEWCMHPKMGLPPLAAEGYVSDCYMDTSKD